jgi:hypothetical protein
LPTLASFEKADAPADLMACVDGIYGRSGQQRTLLAVAAIGG